MATANMRIVVKPRWIARSTIGLMFTLLCIKAGLPPKWFLRFEVKD